MPVLVAAGPRGFPAAMFTDAGLEAPVPQPAAGREAGGGGDAGGNDGSGGDAGGSADTELPPQRMESNLSDLRWKTSRQAIITWWAYPVSLFCALAQDTVRLCIWTQPSRGTLHRCA